MDDRIFKYDLKVEQRQMLMLPRGAELLTVAVINEQAVLFALIKRVEAKKQKGDTGPRIIRIARTGERFNSQGCEYIGLLPFENGHTFHVFEQTEKTNDPLEPRFKPDYEETARGPE